MNQKQEAYPENRVLIVGGGPVGLTLALVLARCQIPSLILEAREQPTPKDESRAIVWMPRGLEMLKWLGVEQTFLEKGVLRYTHQFQSADRTLMTWSLKAVQSPYPYSLQLPQHDTEAILEQQALDTGLVEIRRGHQVIKAGQEQEKAAVTVRCKQHEYMLTAPWGVACDGAKSAVRQELKINKTWRDYGMYSAVADFEMKCSLDKQLSNIVLDPERPYGFFYFAPGRWRFIYRINKDEDRQEATSEDFIRRLLHEKLPEASIHRFLWASSFRLGQGQSETYRKGRWLLAGDAAHAMGPSAGAGMMVGVLGAWGLGWRLALVINNHSKFETLLDDYCKEQFKAAQEIQNNNALIFRNLAVHNAILAAGRAFMLRRLSGISSIGKTAFEKEALLRQKLPVTEAFDYHVPVHSIAKKKIGKWALGCRIPYFSHDKYFNLFADTRLKHTVVSIGQWKPIKEQELFNKIRTSMELPVYEKLISPNEHSPYRLHTNKFLFAIIRPDQHIVSLFQLDSD